MNFAPVRVSFKRIVMMLRWPSPARYTATWTLVWVVALLCLLLDGYSLQTEADSAWIGAELRSVHGAVRVVEIAPMGTAANSGLRVGDRILAIDGRSVQPSAFITDPDNLPTWADRDLFWQWQKFLGESTAPAQVSLNVQSATGSSKQLVLRVHPVGMRRALARSWSLRLVGWSFVVLSLLVWVRRQNETSLVNLVCGCSVFVAFSSMASYTFRNYQVPLEGLNFLSAINVFGTLGTVITLHLALLFPAPTRLIQHRPWLRWLPWALYGMALMARGLHLFSSAAPIIYITSASALGLFFLMLLGQTFLGKDPLIKAQSRWVTLGSISGFLPWVMFSAIPEALHFTPVPEHLTLLPAVSCPVCVAFAVLRYRLLDVEFILDWVMVHTVALGAFSLLELALWDWLSFHLDATSRTRPLIMALSVSLALAFYAPLRNMSLYWLSRRSGNQRPSASLALQKLLERSQTNDDPLLAIEQTLRWALRPSHILWVNDGSTYDALLQKLDGLKRAVLGFELGSDCPDKLEAAAWIPYQVEDKTVAVVLSSRGSKTWTRNDLRLAEMVLRAGQPLFEIRRIKLLHQSREKIMREQREEIVREMHDGLGSQLFGASLLTRVNGQMKEAELRDRFNGVSDVLSDAMDSLRTGLTVLSTPPGAFGPAVLSMLMRAERVLEAAGIVLETDFDEEAASLQLNSHSVFGLLRTMQEALTNIARHSQGSRACVRLVLQGCERTAIDAADAESPQQNQAEAESGCRQLEVRISDNGVGIAAEEKHPGHGLTNIVHRMKLLNGKAEIDSRRGGGCTVVLQLPIGNGVL